MTYQAAVRIDSFTHPPGTAAGTLTLNCSWVSLDNDTGRGKVSVTLVATRDLRLDLADELEALLGLPARRILVLGGG